MLGVLACVYSTSSKKPTKSYAKWCLSLPFLPTFLHLVGRLATFSLSQCYFWGQPVKHPLFLSSNKSDYVEERRHFPFYSTTPAIFLSFPFSSSSCNNRQALFLVLSSLPPLLNHLGKASILREREGAPSPHHKEGECKKSQKVSLNKYSESWGIMPFPPPLLAPLRFAAGEERGES